MLTKVLLIILLLTIPLKSVRTKEKGARGEVEYWIEKRENVVVLHFSDNFPRLAPWEHLIFLDNVYRKGDVSGVDLRPSGYETLLVFIHKKGKLPKVVEAVRRQLESRGYALKEVPPPQVKTYPLHPTPPARDDSRAVFYI